MYQQDLNIIVLLGADIPGVRKALRASISEARSRRGGTSGVSQNLKRDMVLINNNWFP